MSEFGFLFEDKIGTVDSNAEIKGSVIKTKSKKQQRLIVRKKELEKIFPVLEKDTALHMISSDAFGSIELLKVVKDQLQGFDELNISTWSYNDEFVKVIDECCKESTKVFVCTDKSMRGRKPALYAQMVLVKEENPEKLIFKVHSMIHSKITLIKKNDMYITIEASANYSNNQRVENFTITENKDLYLFHKEWMNVIIK